MARKYTVKSSLLEWTENQLREEYSAKLRIEGSIRALEVVRERLLGGDASGSVGANQQAPEVPEAPQSHSGAAGTDDDYLAKLAG